MIITPYWMDPRHLQKSGSMKLASVALADASGSFYKYISSTDLKTVPVSDYVTSHRHRHRHTQTHTHTQTHIHTLTREVL